MPLRYRGVRSDRRAGRFQAVVRVDGKPVWLGRWKTKREAAIAHDRAIRYLGLDEPLNLGRDGSLLEPASPDDLRRIARSQERAATKGSAYVGVAFEPRTGKWFCRLAQGSRQLSVQGYLTDEDAAVAHDRLALHERGSEAFVNFPGRDLEPASLGALRRELRATRMKERRFKGFRTHRRVPARGAKAKPKASRYLGVFRAEAASQRPWASLIAVRGKKAMRYLGSYRTARQAAVAVDRAVLWYHGFAAALLNFPGLARKLVPANAAALRAEVVRAHKAETTSRFRGVSRCSRRSGWIAAISEHGRMRWLGRFDVEEEAARTFDREALRLRGRRAKLNFHPDTDEEIGGFTLEEYDALSSRQHRRKRG